MRAAFLAMIAASGAAAGVNNRRDPEHEGGARPHNGGVAKWRL
jgi:hypothetical protein